MNELINLGAGGLLAYLIIKEVFGFLGKKKNNPNSTTQILLFLTRIEQKLDAMHNDIKDK